MGEVYLAEDTSLGRKVAIKLLPVDFTRDDDRVRRFQQEARAASALNHPNIITIFEIGEVESRHFLATEFIDGHTLRQHIGGSQTTDADKSRTREQLKVNEILNIAIQIADALAAAHEAGIVHRDIKPENIMLRRRDSYVKVLDFGLAKLTDAANTSVDPEAPTKAQVKTGAGIVMGTPSYMSPEQARGATIDARTDVWSLGVVIYELVAGCPPFERSTPSEVIALILEREPPPLLRYARDIPAELERIVSKALTKDKEERYQTAKDLLVDLRRLKQRLDVEADIERNSQGREIDGNKSVVPSREVTVKGSTVATANTGVVHSTGENYQVKGVKRYKREAIILLAFFVTLTAGAVVYLGYSRYANRNAVTIRSIAVLPFSNKTSDPNLEYLSDGISESLINSLSHLPDVRIIARNSSFKYRGQDVDAQEAARALGVDAIVTGRVTQVGDSLVISAELVNARDNTHSWGEQYSRKRADVLQIQSDISQEIAQTLRLRLTAGEQEQITKANKINPQAYELLLKARYVRSKGDTENRKAAIDLFQQAIAIDPNYASAYADLTASYRGLINSNILDPKVFMPKAEAAARRAVELDESLPEAHLALAGVKMDAWDWTAAEHEIQRALELNPNLATAHRQYAWYLRIQGRLEESVPELKRVTELDPLSFSAIEAELAVFLMYRQNEQALELAKKMLELNKSDPESHLRVGTLYSRLGKYREAIAQYQEAISLGDHSPDAQILLGHGYGLAGEHEKARAILQQLRTGKDYVSPIGFAYIHIALGEYEQAFAALETAYAAHDQQLIWLRGEVVYDPIRSDPRFADLMRRVGLSPEKR
jgi:serine/threonine-protein kinase